MCGRFTSLTPPEELAAIFETAALNPDLFADFQPSYNVAPSTRIAAVAQDRAGVRRLGRFQWGLVPSWAKDSSGSAKCINARGETVWEKPSFRSSVATKRCLIPMDGFFEWRTIGVAPTKPPAPKQPVYITRRDHRPLAVAGLWSSWKDPQADDDAAWLHTCCVITTEANETIAPIHDRMPVILEAEDWSDWLNVGSAGSPATPASRLAELLIPAEASILSVVRVGTKVNSVRNNSPELIEEIGAHDSPR